VSGNLRIIAAIIRKDLAVLWPLAVLVVLLPILRSDIVLQNLRNDNLRAGTIGVSVLATMLLIVASVHQDASASLREDWLTRPIPRWTMVTAKLVFIAAVACVPATATDFVSALADGRSIGESVTRAASVGHATLGAMLAVVAFAAVTSTLLEAAGALVTFAVAMLVVQAVSGSVLPDGKGTLIAGAEWLSFVPAIHLPIVIAAPVLWLQYGRRRTLLVRCHDGSSADAPVHVVRRPETAEPGHRGGADGRRSARPRLLPAHRHRNGIRRHPRRSATTVGRRSACQRGSPCGRLLDHCRSHRCAWWMEGDDRLRAGILRRCERQDPAPAAGSERGIRQAERH
jgi:hypothetical protein